MGIRRCSLLSLSELKRPWYQILSGADLKKGRDTHPPTPIFFNQRDITNRSKSSQGLGPLAIVRSWNRPFTSFCKPQYENEAM